METLQNHLTPLGHSAPTLLMTNPPSCNALQSAAFPLGACTRHLQKGKKSIGPGSIHSRSTARTVTLICSLTSASSPAPKADASICSLKPPTPPLRKENMIFSLVSRVNNCSDNRTTKTTATSLQHSPCQKQLCSSCPTLYAPFQL